VKQVVAGDPEPESFIVGRHPSAASDEGGRNQLNNRFRHAPTATQCSSIATPGRLYDRYRDTSTLVRERVRRPLGLQWPYQYKLPLRTRHQIKTSNNNSGAAKIDSRNLRELAAWKQGRGASCTWPGEYCIRKDRVQRGRDAAQSSESLPCIASTGNYPAGRTSPRINDSVATQGQKAPAPKLLRGDNPTAEDQSSLKHPAGETPLAFKLKNSFWSCVLTIKLQIRGKVMSSTLSSILQVCMRVS
jgi:hypothetical protein